MTQSTQSGIERRLARYANPYTAQIWSNAGHWQNFAHDAPITLQEAEAREEELRRKNPLAKFRVVPWLNNSQTQHVREEIKDLKSERDTTRAERDALKKALAQLTNEAIGFVALAHREIHGNTNINVMNLRITEAREALAALSAPVAAVPPGRTDTERDWPRCKCGGVTVGNASGDITRTYIRCGRIVRREAINAAMDALPPAEGKE